MNLSAIMIAILDIDGTLVDTNYQHAISWFRAFRDHDLTLPIWQLHRHIGMGGDQLVTAVTDEKTEERLGDELRAAESEHYMTMIDEVRPMECAHALIEELNRRGHQVVFASSAKDAEVDVYLDLLEARDIVEAWTTSADVESTKPAPDLVQAALEKVDGRPDQAVLIGDTPWDVEAALKAGVPTLTVLTGGFSAQELTDAGAVSVFESVAQLREQLNWTALR
jgi:HAD superfamily hydrolase (TIGR01509 family)